MKWIVFLVLVLLIIAPMLKAQNVHDPIYGNLPPKEKESKMNPDGYINGVTFVIEPGYDFANGKFEQDTKGLSSLGRVSQNVSIRNPFLKLAVLLPMQENSTVFVNTLIGSFEQESKETDFFLHNKISYTRFSISAGIKLYVK